ncbi:ATP-dependent helicase [Alkalihalobacterium chitinilyticum]|uniref:DNA 3'-5' helicase n=1 Tax=Alkalihalobacterium chitinilyticum TaxID=2980103 RepID=A0ABT5VBH9_9BACI|nr:ATP-dependent helicase [Alkalihalobacterium chitinilyticum]MDE5412697.1 ATP-dependent helicase [Alkalihalobacterium chitinilyticum]
MEVAFWNERLVQLANIDASQYQQLYRDSKRGRLTCPHCGEKMSFSVSIQHPPHFVHVADDEECETAVTSLLDKKKEELISSSPNKTTVGFRLPDRRTISSQSSTKPAEINWKKPEIVCRISNFQEQNDTTGEISHTYYQELSQEGFKLDPYQWEAVTTTEGPLLILAGAGSGKTRVLTARAAYMMTEKQIPSNRLLLVTFTAKAAREMKERMLQYPNLKPSEIRQLLVGTFHSIFYKMLLHHDPNRWHQDRLLKWEWQKERIAKQVGRELGLEEKEFAYDQALTQIGWWKNNLIIPDQVEPKDIFEERTLHIYKHYEEIKEKEQLFDFDDMLIGCYYFLSENRNLLEKYQERFSYISVDEFQDINKVQYQIVQLLAQPQNNLCVVGDDDQSIYSFRGSNPSYILNFKKEYPATKTVILAKNYRSVHSIVSSASYVISKNKHRYDKQLSALSNSDFMPLVFFPFDEELEATIIVEDLKERIAQGASPSDFAILYRTNVSTRALFERLVHTSLPFIVEQEGDSFYQRKTVRKILAYMQLSINPNHTDAMSDLIGALFLKQDVLRDLKALSIIEDCSLVEALTKLTQLPAFQLKKLKTIVPLFSKIPSLKPVDAIDFIEKEMGLTDYLKKQGNEGNAMDKGSDDVRDLRVAAQSHPSVPEFLEYVDHIIHKHKEIVSNKNTMTGEAIQLMTIHRSKGLEFKQVYVIGAVDGGLPHDYALDAWRDGNDEPMEEERRLMYVAMTRAKEALYISVPSMRRGKKAIRSRFLR